MKFIPAFLSLFLFASLAYMVWTNQYPYHWLPEDPSDPNRLERAERFITQGVGYLGELKTSLILLGLGLASSLFFVMEPRDR
ncbi:MAG: hypothetical protein AAF700_12880 [Pseudomonadota bacterium]